jgi:hypothetical protein
LERDFGVTKMFTIARFESSILDRESNNIPITYPPLWHYLNWVAHVYSDHSLGNVSTNRFMLSILWHHATDNKFIMTGFC